MAIKGSDLRFKVDSAQTKIYKVCSNYRKILGKQHIYPTFQTDLVEFKNTVMDIYKKQDSKTFIHFGDGDYFFLSQIPFGSAKPKRRALSKSYDELDITPFITGFIKNDYICLECLEIDNKQKLLKLYPDIKVSYPTEFLYGLLSSKWFFKQFPNSISLIGAEEKLDIIKELMNYEQYKNYLGIQEFKDYIKIPQKFACDNLENTCQIVKQQLENSATKSQFKIFICGMGHVKSGLYHRMIKWHKGLYIDVGSGIDALAGIVNHNRPYMATWINYHLRNYNYSKIDFLQYNLKNDKLCKTL